MHDLVVNHLVLNNHGKIAWISLVSFGDSLNFSIPACYMSSNDSLYDSNIADYSLFVANWIIICCNMLVMRVKMLIPKMRVKGLNEWNVSNHFVDSLWPVNQFMSSSYCRSEEESNHNLEKNILKPCFWSVMEDREIRFPICAIHSENIDIDK